MLTCVLICSFIMNFWVHCILLGGLQGLACGIVYYAALTFAWGIYSEIKYKITGISLFFYGAAPFLYNFIIGWCVNPQNLPATLQVNSGKSTTYYY